MNRTIAVALGGFVVLAASAAYGQERRSPVVEAGHLFTAGPSADSSARDEPRSPSLFTIGGLDVHVWAPVEPHYNGAANRDPAAQSFWGAE
jgi:hypothetical protein